MQLGNHARTFVVTPIRAAALAAVTTIENETSASVQQIWVTD